MIIFRFILIAAVCAALAGCFSYPSKDEADQTAREDLQRCENQRLAGKLPTHEAVVICAAQPIVDAYQHAGYAFMDLVYIRLEALRYGAQKIDAGAATDAQVAKDMAELDSRIAAEQRRRRALMAQGSKVEPQPPETLVQGLATLQPYTVGLGGPNAGCFTLGDQKHCPQPQPQQ